MEELAKVMTNELPLWSSKNGSAISRSFVAKDFSSALTALNDIGNIAEREGHHPDLHLTSYREVVIVLYTHSVRGVTGNDIVLAKMIDAEVKIDYSPEWLLMNRKAAGTQKKNSLQGPKEVEMAKTYIPCDFRLDRVTRHLTKEFPLWVTQQGSAMSRSFTAKDFKSALHAINEVGKIAELLGHYPDLHLTSYRNVVIVVHTSSIEGISENDLNLAKIVDKEVKIDYSRQWLKEHPQAQATAKN